MRPPLLLLTLVSLLHAPLSGQDASALGTEKPTADPAAAVKRIKELGGNEYDLGGVRFNSASREIRIPCTVNMQDGLIEFALVHETGKTHESILKTAVNPVDIQVALLLCNYKPGHDGLFDYEKDTKVRGNLEETKAEVPGANRVQCFVEWTAGDVKKKTELRDWIRDGATKKTPEDFKHWIFNGSMVQESGFSAALHGNLIGIYYDVTSILNCPSPRNRNDEVWLCEKEKIPAVDAPVTLILAPVP